MHEAGGIWILFGDEGGELFNERDGEIAGDRSRSGESVQIKFRGVAICRDRSGCGRGNEAGFGFGASQRGFEIEHRLDASGVGEKAYDGRGIEESIEKRHEESVIFPGRRKNDFVREEGVR